MTRFCLMCLLFIIGLSFVKAKAEEEKSPVLLWSPERSMVDLPDVSSVDSFSPSDFYSQYLSPLLHEAKENAVVFLQDKLSVDDFTKYADVFSITSGGGAFKNVKSLMEDHYSLEVPQVDAPHLALKQLEDKFDGRVHNIERLSQLKSKKLNGGKRFLLIVNLHPVIGSADEEAAISRNDALIGDVARHLQDQGIKYSAVFTGKSSQQSNEEPQSSDSSQYSNRHLLATADPVNKDNCTFMNITGEQHIYVFMCGMKLCLKDATAKDPSKCSVSLTFNATDKINVAAASWVKNNTAELNLQFDKVIDETTFIEYNATLVIDIALQQDRWVMERHILYLKQENGTTSNKTDIGNATLINYSLDTVIPRPYSFHCTRHQMFLETVKDVTYKRYAGSSITLEAFQFSVYDNPPNNFFNAQDCVGFFTAGIWMGIVPSLILIAILVYGTKMILSLSVMDKFDDPKGKSITVNVSE